MTANPRTLEYLIAGVDALVAHGSFRNGQSFRPTQNDALQAYHAFLHSPDFTPEYKLKGFFEIPMGVGKTALFLSILDEAHRTARAAKDKLRFMIVVPSVAILEQMKGNEEKKGEIEEWAPDYLNTVGYYGGDYRDIGEELTIIIYNSWVTLMEQGLIDSTNIDILTSDEAHRGTSERRLKNQFNAFSNGTSQVAFTATARFDDEKSVEQSHGHQIFSRGVGESIRLGELAAYIQTQLHVIRIDPKDVENALAQIFNVYGGSDIIEGPAKLEEDEEQDEDSKLKRAVMAGIKQDTWIRDMVAVFRDGRDEHTLDPLTDNQSGFYVEGTAMAERLADVASADPVLQARAKEKGCKGVIAPVHSKMPANVQRDIMAAFERGEYLGIASDSKLKEGYNYKKLKNIFDYPRNSRVDKAQIIGRGARQWFNEAKNRYEGSTIIDTIIYVGSEDPVKDEELKKNALRNAVLAWDVLEGTAVYGPAAPASKAPPRGGGEPSIEPMYGLNVTSYVSMEDLRAIYAEKVKLNGTGVIPLTDEMYESLKNSIERAQISYPMLLSSIPSLPSGINVDKIKNWLRITDRSTTVLKEEWDIVLKAAQSFEASPYMTMTKQMRAEFIALADKVRVKDKDFGVILKNAGLKSCLKSSRIWYNPRQSVGKILKSEWYNVMTALSPHERIAITDEMRFELRQEIGRVGLTHSALAKALNDNRVNEAKIKTWTHLKSAVRTAAKGEWEFVLGSLRELPEAKNSPVLPNSRPSMP